MPGKSAHRAREESAFPNADGRGRGRALEYALLLRRDAALAGDFEGEHGGGGGRAQCLGELAAVGDAHPDGGGLLRAAAVPLAAGALTLAAVAWANRASPPPRLLAAALAVPVLAASRLAARPS